MVNPPSSSGASTAASSGSSREDTYHARKSGLSCAECRRSKLKCDRVFPCQSCIRRGCAAICPDGALAATKGNKVLVARVERLQGQVKAMSSRIRELESALRDAQSQGDKQSHPLLASAVKWEEVDEVDLPPDSDTESVSGGALLDEGTDLDDSEEMFSLDTHHLGLPTEIVTLASVYPLGVSRRPTLSSQSTLFQFIPPRTSAETLKGLYYTCAAWLYAPVPESEFDQLLEVMYAPDTTPAMVHPHSVAVFFMVLCIGSTFDSAHPDSEIYTERLHALARAALSSHSILHWRTCATIQALFLLNFYKYITPRPSPEYLWLMVGLCGRLAQAMGLQRDCGGQGLETEEVQKRRVIFWELFYFETWSSLLIGRPSILNLRHINCRFPEDRESVTFNGEVEIGWHSWVYRFAAGCMSLATQHVFGTKRPTYAALLELDAKIRRFPVPRYLRCPLEHPATPWSDNPRIAMQQFSQYGHVEHTILYLHRAHFTQLRESDPNVRPGRSVWAIYRSSARLFRDLQSFYNRYPEILSKIWYLCAPGYSACNAMGALIREKPWCQLSPHALNVLNEAAELYEKVSQGSSISSSTLSVVQDLVRRSRTAISDHHLSRANRQCNADCCAKLAAEEVRRFAEGDDEIIPGEAGMASPYMRQTSASPGSSGGGGDLAQDPRHNTPAPAVPPLPAVRSMAAPAPPTEATATSYQNYNPFMPASIGVTTPAPHDHAYTPHDIQYAAHAQEAWFTASYAAEQFSPQVGGSGFAHDDSIPSEYRLAMQSPLPNGAYAYFPASHTPSVLPYSATPGEPASWADYRGQSWSQ